jgi:Na+-driven multidrug efflux pump
MNGLSGAVGIIIGKCVGKGKVKILKEYTYTTQAIFIILGILTSLTLLLTQNPFISLYTISEEAVSVAKTLITVLSITIIGTSYQSACLIGIVRGGGDTSFILKNDAVFIFLGVIPLTVLALKLSAPIWLVFFALKCDQIFKCIPAAVKINRFRWIKNLTK